MRKDVDAHDADFREMEPAPSVLDVASLLKQFLRELAVPIVPRIFHAVLASAVTSSVSDRVENLLLGLLLLPSEHLASFSFLIRHLDTVAQSSGQNKMTASNLAIVLTPNLLPVQDNQAANQPSVKLDRKSVDQNNVNLRRNTNILELLIKNSADVGFVQGSMLERQVYMFLQTNVDYQVVQVQCFPRHSYQLQRDCERG